MDLSVPHEIVPSLLNELVLSPLDVTAMVLASGYALNRAGCSRTASSGTMVPLAIALSKSRLVMALSAPSSGTSHRIFPSYLPGNQPVTARISSLVLPAAAIAFAASSESRIICDICAFSPA